MRLFHTELEAYLSAEGLFDEKMIENGRSLLSHFSVIPVAFHECIHVCSVRNSLKLYLVISVALEDIYKNVWRRNNDQKQRYFSHV